MKKILLVLFCFLYSISMFPQVMCIAGKKFEYSEGATRVGVESTFKVTFDIEKFSPVNIKIELADADELNNASDLVRQINKCTIKNIKSITYLKDTSNFSINIHYLLKQSSELNNDYAELENGNELYIYTRMNVVNKYPHYCTFGPEKSDSTYKLIDIPFELIKGELKKSDILVERIFNDGKDSTVVIRNNYPELSEYVIKQAAQLKKSDFINDEKAKYFFVYFNILREVKECGIWQIF